MDTQKPRKAANEAVPRLTEGYPTQEDLFRDQVRDSILLNEFNIITIRVTNSEVIADVDQVAQMIISEIRSLED